MAKKLKKWIVTGTVIGGKYLGTFKAKTAEEAVENALKDGNCDINLCHECANECEDPNLENVVAEEET